jgi:hypothetical protein
MRAVPPSAELAAGGLGWAVAAYFSEPGFAGMECWFPSAQVLECRASLETYHDLRREHTTQTRSKEAICAVCAAALWRSRQHGRQVREECPEIRE